MSSALSAKGTATRLRLSAAILACLLVAGCGNEPSDPESEVRAWVAKGVEAAESESRRDLMNMISEAYEDGRGNSREDIGNMLRVYFLRADNVTLLAHIDAVRIIGNDVAEVELNVGMAGATNSALGFSADAYKFSLELQKIDDWQLISARWAEMGGKLH